MLYLLQASSAHVDIQTKYKHSLPDEACDGYTPAGHIRYSHALIEVVKSKWGVTLSCIN